MSYEAQPWKIRDIRYDWGTFTLSGAAGPFAVLGPKNKKGRLLDYGIDGITTSTAGATNTPGVSVGPPGTAQGNGANFFTGVLTAPNSASVAALNTRFNPAPGTPGINPAWSALMVNEDLPANTLVVLTFIPAAGAGAAGVGVPFMIIAWDD